MNRLFCRSRRSFDSGPAELAQSNRRTRRADFIFFACVLAAALAALGWVLWQRRIAAPGLTALLTYGDAPQQTMTIPLSQDATYDIDTGYYTVHIRVQGETAAFVNSPCPDHTCEGFGRLSKEGDWAACLPAKALLTIETEDSA